jgi:CRP-like cAMP-binding protein
LVAVIEQRHPSGLTLSSERLDVARAMLRDHVQSGRAPSMAAVVLHNGRVVLEESVGVQRPDGPALDLEHMWPITSAGKPILAATVFSLVEEGRIGVEFFLIVDGTAAVLRSGKKVASLGPGGHFGELAVLDRRPRSATVVS